MTPNLEFAPPSYESHLEEDRPEFKEYCKTEAVTILSKEKSWYKMGSENGLLIEALTLKQVHTENENREELSSLLKAQNSELLYKEIDTNEMNQPRAITEAEIKDLLINKKETIINETRIKGILKAIDDMRATNAFQEIKETAEQVDEAKKAA